MAAQVWRPSKDSDAPTSVQCDDCVRRRRRGMVAKFKATDSSAVRHWLDRHSKH